MYRYVWSYFIAIFYSYHWQRSQSCNFEKKKSDFQINSIYPTVDLTWILSLKKRTWDKVTQQRRITLWRYKRLASTDIRKSRDKDILLLPDMIWCAGLFFSSLSKWSFIRHLINMLSWLSGMRETHFIFKNRWRDCLPTNDRDARKAFWTQANKIISYHLVFLHMRTHTCTPMPESILTQWFTALTHILQ